MLKFIFPFLVSCCMGHAQLPDQFFVEQHWFSLTNAFSIKTEQETLGTVYRKLLTLNLQYEFNDPDEKLVATARARFFSLGAIFDVTDAEETYLGRIDEYVFTFFPKFDILSQDEKILATAEMNIWGTTYTFRDQADDHVIAIMHRDFFRLKDDWAVTIHDQSAFGPDKIDPKIMILLAAFQTDLEAWSQQNHIIDTTQQNGNNDS